MNMYGLLQQTPTPTLDQVENNFSGNICRCTGYRPILAAFHTFAKSEESQKHAAAAEEGKDCKTSGMGAGCCSTDDKKSSTKSCKTISVDAGVRTGAGHKAGCTGTCGTCSHNTSGCASDIEDIGKQHQQRMIVTPYDPKNAAHNKPFPKELTAYVRKSLYFVSDSGAFFKPQQLSELWDLLVAYPSNQVRLMVGNTSTGVQKYYRFNPNTDAPSIFIDICAIPNFAATHQDANYLYIGATQSLTNVINILTQVQNNNPGVTTRHFTALIRHLNFVANGQVRYLACWSCFFMF
jgi:xanthine dehydrogenase/oxidase